MLTASLKGTATTVFLLGLLSLGMGVTLLARADEEPYEPTIVEAEALFRDGDVVHSVRVLTHGLSQAEADTALRSFLGERSYDLNAAYFVPGHRQDEGGDHQEAEGGVTAEFANLFAVWPAADIPVPVHFNAANGAGLPALEPAVQHAIAQWNSVQNSSFSFSYAGSSSAETCVGQGPNADGNNVVRYAELENANVLGVTCSSYLTVGFSAGEYIEFDMELNTSVQWDDAQPTDPSSYDVWTTTLHEFGHALGLNHTQSNNCGGGSPAVMCASLGTGVSVRTLTQDDIDAVLSQYGPAPTPTATSPATATPTATPTSPAPTLPALPTVPNAVPTSTATPTAETTGTPSATATPTATPSGTPTATATPPPTERGPFRSFVAFVAGGSGAAPSGPPPAATTTPAPTATPTPTAAPTPPAAAGEGEVIISTVRYNPPEANDASGEFVELRSTGDAAVQLEGWSIHDMEGEFYTFSTFTLQAGATVRVHNCTGNDSASNLYTGNCQAVWNNSGDTAYLYDAGGELIAEYSYL